MESVKGRHLHSKPEAGITRADLLNMKEEDEKTEELLFREAEEEEDEEIRDEEELESDEMYYEEDMPHVIFEPKRQTSLAYPQPPQEKCTATDREGFCVLSYLALHKDLRKCRYCHKYIAEDETSHTLLHAKERREEKEEEQKPFISITIEDPPLQTGSLTKDEDLSVESITSISTNLNLDIGKALYYNNASSIESAQYSKTSQLGNREDRLSHIENEKDIMSYYQCERFIQNEDEISTASSEKKYFSSSHSKSSFLSSKSERSSISQSIKGRTSSISHIKSSVTNIKEAESSSEVISQHDLSEFRKNKIEEELLEKEKRRVFDKIAKSWLQYY